MRQAAERCTDWAGRSAATIVPGGRSHYRRKTLSVFTFGTHPQSAGARGHSIRGGRMASGPAAGVSGGGGGHRPPFGPRPADITGGSLRVYIHRHVPAVSAAGRGQIRGFPLRTLSTFRSRARSLCPRATAAKLRCHHRIQCDSRDTGFTSGPYSRTKPSGARRLAAHDGGDASAALVRCHVRSHGWLVAVPRSGFADALSSSLTSTMETASARN